jgi:hypothetical protein
MIKSHVSIKGDFFDTSNYEMQMRNFRSAVSRNQEIPDDILEPEWEQPHQIQINVVSANELVGDEHQYVDNLEDNDKTLWLEQRQTRGQLAQPPRDERTRNFEDDWQPNPIDNLENLPQLAEKFITRTGEVNKFDRFGNIFKENTQEALDYIQLAADENQRVVERIYQTV